MITAKLSDLAFFWLILDLLNHFLQEYVIKVKL